MRQSRFCSAVCASIVLLAMPLLVGCGGSGGSSSKDGTTGGVADSNLDTAKAVELQVTAAKGGVAEVESADGSTVVVVIPPDAVSQDTTIVVTPLLAPPSTTSKPLTPGVMVVQKGNEDQHLTLTNPAIVTFTLPGKVSKKAKVINFVDATTAQVVPTSLVKQGGMTTVTGALSSFSPTTVDDDPQDPLAPLVEEGRWKLDINGTSEREYQGATIKTTCSGTLRSSALVGSFAFFGMKGPLTFAVSIDMDMGPVAASLTSTEVTGMAKLEESWVQVINKKKGTYYCRGTGNVFINGSATISAQATGGGMSASASETGNATTSAVKMGVKTGGLPGKVGDSVPAIVTIYDGLHGKDTYEATLTRIAK